MGEAALFFVRAEILLNPGATEFSFVVNLS
jgi:hypothetical protein